MPRKANVQVSNEPKKGKKSLMNTMVKSLNNKDENIILQLPLTQLHVNKLVNLNKQDAFVNEPIPYEKNCCFVNEVYNNVDNTDNVIDFQEDEIQTNDNHTQQCCFWCCHSIEYKSYGMPLSYENSTDTYVMYGTFCSLQCANAFNFSTNRGSDILWEINSMIQMIGKHYGITNFIRPAPSKYLLKMFNGYLSIEEFRKLHKNNDTSHVLNLPPMISIPSGYEVVNTSYIKKISEC